jgi:uncharacterized membrane protein
MESKAKLFGHPIHPMLIVFPLGLLVMSLIFDLVRAATGDVELTIVAYWCIAAGIIGGLAAAVFGVVDWLAIPSGTRAKHVGLWHGAGNVVVVGLFAASWWLRSGSPSHVPGGPAMVLSLVAVLLGAVTGWLGGELVDRLGVGVDIGAHLDAPSSLSGRPAHRTTLGQSATRQSPLPPTPRAA